MLELMEVSKGGCGLAWQYRCYDQGVSYTAFSELIPLKMLNRLSTTAETGVGPGLGWVSVSIFKASPAHSSADRERGSLRIRWPTTSVSGEMTEEMTQGRPAA